MVRERDLKHITRNLSLFNRQSQACKCLAQGHNVMIYEQRDSIGNVTLGAENTNGDDRERIKIYNMVDYIVFDCLHCLHMVNIQ